MLNKKRCLVPAAMLFACLAGEFRASAQGTLCYTAESLQGTFAVIGTYGSNLAIAFSVREHDESGGFVGPFIINQPVAGSSTGERNIIRGTNRGSFQVNCDGSGVITRTATLSDGTTIPTYDDFVITNGIVQDGKLVATALRDAQRSASIVQGSFLSRKHVRLPSSKTAGCYTLASLQGSYGVEVNYDFNAALGLQPEYLDGEGHLWRKGINNQPVAGSLAGERTVGSVTSEGTYTVECNGTGKITRIVTRPDGTKAAAVDDFIITGAVEKDGRLLATSIFDVQQGPAVVGAGTALVTRLHTLRPNANEKLEKQLEMLACGTDAPAAACQTTVSVWNYYMTTNIDPKAPNLVSGDGTEMMSVRRYLWMRAAAQL